MGQLIRTLEWDGPQPDFGLQVLTGGEGLAWCVYDLPVIVAPLHSASHLLEYDCPSAQQQATAGKGAAGSAHVVRPASRVERPSGLSHPG